MEKVKCVKCGSIGYTASPRYVNCSECGGAHRVIDMEDKGSKHDAGVIPSFLGITMERSDKNASTDIA